MVATTTGQALLETGRVLANKYVVEGLLGSGWEGEVYRVVERRTGIHRAIKLFYPERNPHDRALRFYATKLHRLRDCDIVIKYLHSEAIRARGQQVTCLVSEYIEGELLSELVAAQPGRRLRSFEAMHLLHALASGLEQIHEAREYHGDLHDGNVMVERRGIFFAIKLIDFYHWGPARAYKIAADVTKLIRIFYDALGGRKHYASQPPQVKAICCGLRRDLILKKFPTAGHLREHLETFDWDDA